MSTVFFAWSGQPRSQRPRLSQPCWKTPLNGWRRPSPKWTASGSRFGSRPARAQLRLATGLGGGGECVDLGQGRFGRRRARLERLLGEPVPRIEFARRDRARPTGVEHVGGRAKLDARVDQRAAANPGGRDHGEVLHQAHVEESAGVRLLVPEHAGRLLRPIGKIVATEAATAFQDADALARFSQSAGSNAAPETRADHDDVVSRL